ncbi:hypothetical protein KVT40_004427 [Elsinoe batatas]|uniref:NAD(+) diphosphatase n=1 Tax=Elsinoe batatas TaxID=2601811 RepID=A0A8K0L4X6_9PEZI|nr:hypothetical protein KVT40_004427 [Elsinoe batatas]
MPPPELPAPAHPEIDSMLSRKFGREVANYFSGSPLNRVGFLRGDTQFLSLALRHPSTSFLLCNDLTPLVSDKTRLAYVKYEDVKGLIGEDVYTVEEEELIKSYDSGKSMPQMIFLGLDERKDGVTYTPKKGTYKGAPYFAVDVTPREGVKEAAEKLIQEVEGRGLSWGKGRVMDLVAGDAAIFAEARQLLDWNLRNPFCAQCGQPTLSVNGGFKRTCPPADAKRLVGATATNAQAPSSERPPCATRKGISNLSFPRTDPTVIMAVVNSAGTHILLGRSKRFPPYWYSTLAGFCEPAESIEEAVRREVWEEAGIHLGRVVVHSTQPWPYPANLMIGAIGQSVPNGETIDLGNDPELEDAKWYTFDEVREALRVGTSGIGEDAGPEYKEGGLRLPPSTAIAHQLITAVVQKGFISAEPKM